MKNFFNDNGDVGQILTGKHELVSHWCDFKPIKILNSENSIVIQYESSSLNNKS